MPAWNPDPVPPLEEPPGSHKGHSHQTEEGPGAWASAAQSRLPHSCGLPVSLFRWGKGPCAGFVRAPGYEDPFQHTISWF